MAILRLIRRLNSADLPTFGRPTIATFGYSLGRHRFETLYVTPLRMRMAFRLQLRTPSVT